ncbi:glutamate-cysteine ligase family protein [Streptosporangium sandarakinum]|uniref:glutamate-cysteine ligase family protein n=1 Tax=Streptosporangium sandarakinum TaxID=1260955 RepID=UPI003D89FA48
MNGLVTGETPIRDAAEVEDFARRCFGGGPGDRLGIELEFLVFDLGSPASQVPLDRVAAALPPLPGGSRVTFEPGGQLELSGPAGPLPEAVARIAADVDAARGALREAGLALAGAGLDPVRPARRQLRLPRYDAMAAFFGSPYGPLMMCSTASVQVNVDLGERPEARWERAHLLGPVLSAAFANSPLLEGGPCGWMSGRQVVWERLDPTRTAPVPLRGDPVAAWRDYLLDARVMLVREEDGDGERYRPVGDGSSLRDWLAASRAAPARPASVVPPRPAPGSPGPSYGSPPRPAASAASAAPSYAGRGLPARPPTLADLAYHATTVFPPVRPRGWLEIRYLDAQHPAWWPVCAAVTHALVTDDLAAGAALAAAEPYAGSWARVARHGLADPGLRAAADACFRAALAALPRLGAPPALVRRTEAFADRYVTPGRSPAADLLDLFGATAPAGRAAEPERNLAAWLAGEEGWTYAA